MVILGWIFLLSAITKIYVLILFFFKFPGEVERLLKEYRQNQELVRRIGSHYYQIIYPVQLRHHEKMGISTREVNAPKVRNRIRKRNTNDYDSMVCFVFSLSFMLIIITYNILSIHQSPINFQIESIEQLHILVYIHTLHID